MKAEFLAKVRKDKQIRIPLIWVEKLRLEEDQYVKVMIETEEE